MNLTITSWFLWELHQPNHNTLKSQSNNFFKLINAFQRVCIAKVHPANCVKFFNSRTAKYEHLCKIHPKFYHVLVISTFSFHKSRQTSRTRNKLFELANAFLFKSKMLSSLNISTCSFRKCSHASRSRNKSFELAKAFLLFVPLNETSSS
jgi:hypothetical protein